MIEVMVTQQPNRFSYIFEQTSRSRIFESNFETKTEPDKKRTKKGDSLECRHPVARPRWAASHALAGAVWAACQVPRPRLQRAPLMRIGGGVPKGARASGPALKAASSLSTRPGDRRGRGRSWDDLKLTVGAPFTPCEWCSGGTYVSRVQARGMP